MELEARVKELEDQVSFLAAMLKYMPVGHATPRSYDRLDAIAAKFERERE